MEGSPLFMDEQERARARCLPHDLAVPIAGAAFALLGQSGAPATAQEASGAISDDTVEFVLAIAD